MNKKQFILKNISALNQKQREVLSNSSNQMLIGSAGTGKTFLASYLAFRSVIIKKQFSQVLFVRSAVATRDIGFLPGTEQQKMQVYKLPYKQICSDLFGRTDSYQQLQRAGIARFIPTSFVRGTNLSNTVLILDQIQNMTHHQVQSVITRVGQNCKVFICGDQDQPDLAKNGFRDFSRIIKSMPQFNTVSFGLQDIVRSQFVKSYLTKKAEHRMAKHESRNK